MFNTEYCKDNVKSCDRPHGDLMSHSPNPTPLNHDYIFDFMLLLSQDTTILMHPKHDLIVEILELLEQEGITLRDILSVVHTYANTETVAKASETLMAANLHVSDWFDPKNKETY